jgi:urea transport system substrate-binding protein
MKKQIPMASTTFGLGNEHVVVSAEEGDGILASYAYFDEVATPANQAFLKRYHKRFGDKAAPLTEVAAMTYHGFELWSAAVKKAGTIDRMKVIAALESGLSIEGPAGKTTLDPATHHDILDVYIGEVENKKFKLLKSFSQQKPADTAAVCDLVKTPNDNQQYVIDVKV